MPVFKLNMVQIDCTQILQSLKLRIQPFQPLNIDQNLVSPPNMLFTKSGKIKSKNFKCRQ